MYWSRLKVFLALVMLGMLVLGARLAYLQLSRADVFRRAAAKNLERPVVLLETRRGSVRDRTGQVLAEDVPRFDLCVYYPFLALKDEAFLRRKAVRDGISADEAARQMAPFWLGGDEDDGRQAAARRLRQLKAQLGREGEPDERLLDEMSDLWPDLAAKAGFDLDALDMRREEVLREVAAVRDRVRRFQGRDVLVREEAYRAPGAISHAVVLGLDSRAMTAVADFQSDRPYLQVRQRAERRYRHNDVAAHVVGYVGEAGSEHVGRLPGGGLPVGVADDLRAYSLGDERGVQGVERSLEGALRGSLGMERRRRDGTVIERYEAVTGADVILTLDVPFQAELEGLMGRPPNLPAGYGRVRGAAVVIDLRTGGILALVSAPRYGLNSVFAEWKELRAEGSGRPLVHRAIAGEYSLGSIFKIVTTTAALHEGNLTADTTLHCSGILDPAHPNRFRCMGTHGDISLLPAIWRSCNVYFYQVSQMVGGERLTAWGRRFGFGRRVGLLLPSEADGNLPDGIDPRNLTIGQGELMVTPLQVARLAALAATGGQMWEVHVVAEVRPGGSPHAALPVGPGYAGLNADLRELLHSGAMTVVADGAAPAGYTLRRKVSRVDLGLRPDLAAVVRLGLRGVVNEAVGTGHRTVYSSLVPIAGKTGSAQVGSGDTTHSWFVGYAPADDPQIAFAVTFERAGHGGTVAGPVARQIVETALRQKIISVDRPSGKY